MPTSALFSILLATKSSGLSLSQRDDIVKKDDPSCVSVTVEETRTNRSELQSALNAGSLSVLEMGVLVVGQEKRKLASPCVASKFELENRRDFRVMYKVSNAKVKNSNPSLV